MNRPILAVLQARMSSSRLPGKVLQPILGEPMLFRQLERVRRSHRIDHLIVVTSTEASDNAIAEMCTERGVAHYRGSLNDVLDRAYHAAEPYRPSHVVRLTGDCPLADPSAIDAVIDFAIRGDFDYATNGKPYTFPDGLDVEIATFAAFEAAWREADLPSHREHVFPFIHRQPERFYLGYVRSSVDLSRHRWTVDEPEDFMFVTRVYEALYPMNPNFQTQDILDFLMDHPELLRMNERFERNAGRRKAFEEDTKFLVAQRAPMLK
ncbi:glycosyltransferase family protein [Candidatus Uhrbacteria bacterium]|nr:glycosyltransferase family protein [Candidatus Uhrbacteria bacterium]